jgi:hypothetical protein
MSQNSRSNAIGFAVNRDQAPLSHARDGMLLKNQSPSCLKRSAREYRHPLALPRDFRTA